MKLSIFLSAAIAGGLSLAAGQATALPSGWTCSGNCGTSTAADGVVTLAPGFSDYSWVSTVGGISGNTAGISGGTNGSVATSPLFAASAGDELAFKFNFITSDGAGWADYGWARLLNSSLNQVAMLFTARTTPSGNTVPGFGMDPINATIDPAFVTVVAGGPAWSPLGGDSGGCFSTGCGYTDWVSATYDILAAGNYYLEFGSANYGDTNWQTGMAFAGTTIAGVPIDDNGVPEPASLALLGLGLAGLGAFRRRKAA